MAKIEDINYIGPYFAGKFRRNNIKSLEDLKRKLKGNTKKQNIQLFNKLLHNKNGGKRIDNYLVSDINKAAWNSLISWGIKKNIPSTQLPSRKRI